MRRHPRSLILRVSGCYSLTLYGQTKYFMVIDNLFDPSIFAEGRPDEKYDLKGSWVDRWAAVLLLLVLQVLLLRVLLVC